MWHLFLKKGGGGVATSPVFFSFFSTFLSVLGPPPFLKQIWWWQIFQPNFLFSLSTGVMARWAGFSRPWLTSSAPIIFMWPIQKLPSLKCFMNHSEGGDTPTPRSPAHLTACRGWYEAIFVSKERVTLRPPGCLLCRWRCAVVGVAVAAWGSYGESSCHSMLHPLLLRHCCYQPGQAGLISEGTVCEQKQWAWLSAFPQGCWVTWACSPHRGYLSEGTLPLHFYHFFSFFGWH